MGKSDGSVESGGPDDFDIFERNSDSNDSHAKFILGVKNIFSILGEVIFDQLYHLILIFSLFFALFKKWLVFGILPLWGVPFSQK